MAQMCGELCGGTVCESCVGGAVGGLCGGAVFHSYLVSLIWFIHGLTEVFNNYVTLWHFSLNVLQRLFLWFSQIKHLECCYIKPPQEVLSTIVFCTNHYLTVF